MRLKGIVLSGVIVVSLAATFLAIPTIAVTARTKAGPVHLTCELLTNPLGIDNQHPQLSWQLEDPTQAAVQTAYRIAVSSSAAAAARGQADVWDSGRVTSPQSVGVPYAGPALEPSKRYYWRVQLWGKGDRPYSASAPAWWEMGLGSSNWKARWIGYLEPEEAELRKGNAPWIWNEGDKQKGNQKGSHDFRLSFSIDHPIVLAALYVAGKDLTSAWVNGQAVVTAGPMPPWGQAPWGTYVRKDVTTLVHSGRNVLAVDSVFNEGSDAIGGMSATLLLETADGSTTTFTSGKDWKTMLDAPEGWRAAGYDDASWQHAVIAAECGKQPLGTPWPTGPVKMLRHGFAVNEPIVSARLYATALGAYEMRLNGEKVGKQILAPGWMDYREHVPYQVYDVTAQVHQGDNMLGAYLAPGWYSTPLMWFRQGNNYGATPPALRAQLRLEHKDGSVEWVATDESWMAKVSPVLKAEIYDGETFDARMVQAGWDTAAGATGNGLVGWTPVLTIHPKDLQVVAQTFQPIEQEQVLQAKAVTSPQAGVYIYDFGQNLAGVARLRIQGAAGTHIRLRFAEVLNPDGTMYTENLRSAKATDDYTLSGKGIEEYQPRFTFHGFRYVELTGAPTRPSDGALRVVVFHTNAAFAARLTTGSSMIDKLWSNILWGQRSNFVGVPTDCPQRDERLGWSADAQVFWRAATYNMDLGAFSRKFAGDLRGTQKGTAMYGIYAPGVTAENPGFGTGWSDAGVIIPWTAWLQYGDRDVAEENWNAMQRYLKTIEDANPDHLWTKEVGIPFGDWLAPKEKTPIHLISTAYWAYDVSRMEQMARSLGHDQEAREYGELFEKIRAAFQKAYVHSDGTVEGPADPDNGFSVDTRREASATPGSQTGYVLALYMDLLPQDLRAQAAEKLVAKIDANGGDLGTGFLGTPYLLAVLTDTGHTDVAYKLLENTRYPSWGYLVDHGATTMWERWNGDQMRGDPSMNSYNHYAYGAVADWIYRYAAGVDAVPDDPGYHTVWLHPHFDATLKSLNFHYDSPYGEIHSAWSVAGPTAQWTVTLPANTHGRLADEDTRYRLVSVNGMPAAKSTVLQQGADGYTLPAGTYRFVFQQK